MRRHRVDLVIVVILVLAVGGKRYAKPQVRPTSPRLVDAVWKMLEQTYIDPTYNNHSPAEIRKRFLDPIYSNDAEERNAARAMLELLGDPQTRLLDPAEFASTAAEFKGETANVGLADPWTLRDERTGALKVLHVISGSPAFRMGMQPNDLIEAIDDVPTKTISRDEAFKRITGNPGTVVQLTIRRDTKQIRADVPRELLIAHTVSAKILTESGRRFGYLALSQFGKDSAREIRDALVNLQKSNAEGIVLDLRNNPGGFVPASREIAGLFLPEKQILYHSIDRTGAAKDFWSSGAQLTSMPLVVIVNGATTSAAEMLAAALQDNHRAILIGSQTFGQGLIHSVQPISDGSAVVIGIARFTTPAGKDLRHHGIMPDVAVPSGEMDDPRGTASQPNRQYSEAVSRLIAEIARSSKQAG
ncbi:MAG TPA: S41 family peptidase [Candidatus Sulfotelmatobacter sp.]|nr:S41 family peptidase [Candidatus Sulfotelmatobacter sp.]